MKNNIEKNNNQISRNRYKDSKDSKDKDKDKEVDRKYID